MLAQFAAAENDFWEKKLSQVHQRTERGDCEEEADDDGGGGSGDADASLAMWHCGKAGSFTGHVHDSIRSQGLAAVGDLIDTETSPEEVLDTPPGIETDKSALDSETWQHG